MFFELVDIHNIFKQNSRMNKVKVLQDTKLTQESHRSLFSPKNCCKIESLNQIARLKPLKRTQTTLKR